MRSKDKNKIYWLFFSAIIIASLITPYIIQKAIILGSEEDDDEEESSLMMIPLTPTPNNSFPDSSYSYIAELDFILGSNNTGNLTECLEALKYDDGNSLEIVGEEGVSGYYYNIEFLFDFYIINYSLYYYDLFLTLKIDSSIYTQTLYLQAYSNESWVSISDIYTNSIDISHKYLEKTTKFRLYHPTFITQDKIVEIEQLSILMTHKGNNLDAKLNGNSGFSIISTSARGSYSDNIPPASNWFYDQRSGMLNMDYNVIYQEAYQPNNQPSETTIVVEMELIDGWIEEYGIENLRLYGASSVHGAVGQVNTVYIQVRDYTSGFVRTEIRYGSNEYTSWFPAQYGVSWDNIDLNKYIQNNKWQFKIRNYFYYGATTHSNTKNWIWFAEADIITDYPDIYEIYTNPLDPISNFEQFEIRCKINENGIPINDVSYFIEDLSTEWRDMEYISNEEWKNSDSIDADEFPNGEYRVWINTTNTKGLYTINTDTFEVFNSFPRINFEKPSKEGEKIEQLYNYNINISLFDIEGDDYKNPEILIYDTNISEPIINWTFMDYNGYKDISAEFPEGLLHFYNFSINPIDYYNNLYHIKVRSNDSREIKIYNETVINIINNPPSIEILEPSMTELITPFAQEIICNITNEEPINTAQWDIVYSINTNFTWKELIYNITTKLWEANFSLLDYEYEDYFLVINATDDKHNTSLEILPLQLHPLLIYNIEENEISYNSLGIIVYSNPTITTEIVGQFKVDHHPIVKERDFEIYIPEKYEDAHKYYINRGFSKYEPVGFFSEGIYTLWYIPTYATSDIIYFSLDKPIIINSLIKEDDDGTLKMEFILRSKHAFSVITIQNQLTKFISDPENYEYTLQYLYAGNWEDFDEDDYDVEAEDFPSFSFVWESIGEGMEISFRFIAVPIEEEESAIGGGLLVGFVALALVELIAQIVLINRRRNRPEKWGWGKYILVSVGIGAGTFIAGFVAGLFLFG